MTLALVRRFALGALALAAAGGLGACSADQSGAAAIVGTQRITVAELQQAADTIAAEQERQKVPAESVRDLQRGELASKIIDILTERAADEQGVTATKAEVETIIANTRSVARSEEEFRKFLASRRVAPDTVEGVARTQVLQQKLENKIVSSGVTDAQQRRQMLVQQLLTTSTQLGVTVNPRYGVWNDQEGLKSPPNDLSQPVASFAKK